MSLQPAIDIGHESEDSAERFFDDLDAQLFGDDDN